jgi:NifB/MoaA-like Fe-S oxidoreductase
MAHQNLHPNSYNSRLNAEKMAEEALAKKMWFYDTVEKAWLTPEEFLHYYQTGEYKDAMLPHITMRSPLDAITTGYKQIKTIHDRLESFTKRVVDYYDKKCR